MVLRSPLKHKRKMAVIDFWAEVETFAKGLSPKFTVVENYSIPSDKLSKIE